MVIVVLGILEYSDSLMWIRERIKENQYNNNGTSNKVYKNNDIIEYEANGTDRYGINLEESLNQMQYLTEYEIKDLKSNGV